MVEVKIITVQQGDLLYNTPDPKEIPLAHFGAAWVNGKYCFFETAEEAEQYSPKYEIPQPKEEKLIDLNNEEDLILLNEKLKALNEKLTAEATAALPWYKKIFNS